jgi:uncharacterized protein YjbJ (UPF0337 family)
LSGSTYAVGTVVVDRMAGDPSSVTPAALRRPTTRSSDMSAIDKIKNKAEELVGDAKEAVGKATGNEELQAEGQRDQAAGNTKQAGEKVKDIFK